MNQNNLTNHSFTVINDSIFCLIIVSIILYSTSCHCIHEIGELGLDSVEKPSVSDPSSKGCTSGVNYQILI